ncbi:MAG TPA: hypothetical protein VMA98_11915 [Candidatus Acidoferrales bacterium]|nr:hypothetical protein [Candidatus Acidoferrales bacterium]
MTLLLVAAACAGGGTFGVPAAAPALTSGGAVQSGGRTARANMTFYIPPPAVQNARKPFYISSNTQAFGVLVVPAGTVIASPPPLPSGIQVFAVTTPSPCAVSSSGGESCTFTVSAPVGNDVFYVDAFATASPGISSIPTAAFISGPVMIPASPAPGATPLGFTLNGAVYKVAVAVASPDPGNTPNTQLFTALVPTSAPLAITAYDAGNNVVMSAPSAPFFAPIVINASPSASLVTLSLINNSPCGSSASGVQASIACAGDLNDLQVVYNGKTTPDPSDNTLDAFTIAATAQPNPSPSPANIVLASNVVDYPIDTGNSYVSNGLLRALADGDLLYTYTNGSSAYIGTFTPSNATATTPVLMTNVANPLAVAVAPQGAFWLLDEEDGGDHADCWSSLSGALSGSAPKYSFEPLDPATGNPVEFETLSVDSANEVWIAGSDAATGLSYAAYFSTASGCPSTAPALTTVALNAGNEGDESFFSAPLAGGGIAYNSVYSGIYLATTALSSVNPFTAALGSGVTSGGVAVDPAGNVYAAFYANQSADIESMPPNGTSLTSLVSLVPTSPGSGNARPYHLSVFSPTGAAADRAAYVDDNFLALGHVGNLNTTPSNFLVALQYPYSLYQTAYGPNGALYVLYLAYNPVSDAYALEIARAVTTRTWSMPMTSASNDCDYAVLSINERSVDSGPFTVVASPAPAVSIGPMPGTDHDYVIEPVDTNSATVQLTVTDINGRTQVIPSFTAYGESC